jgi:hypothetical protein
MSPLLSRRLAALLALLAGLATPAAAGVVSGDLSLGGAPLPRGAQVRDAVVWLESVPDKVDRRIATGGWRWFWEKRARPRLPRLVESGQRFRPHVLALPVGSQLEIRNSDRVWHGAFSVSPAHPFDLGKRSPGHADTLAFDSLGVVAVRCDIHPDMSAFVLVTPNRAFARPDGDGRWTLPELPAGHYVLHAWHPDRGELRRELDVPARGTMQVSLHW